MEQKGSRVNIPKTKILISGIGFDVLKDSGRFPCAVCRTEYGPTSDSVLAVISGSISGAVVFVVDSLLLLGLYAQDAVVRPGQLISNPSL